VNANPTHSFRPSAADLDRVMRQIGVTEAQARRDFVVSWMLWSISRSTPDLVFFGGTALSRTLLPDLRLSEDIDLMPLGPRAVVAAAIHHGLTQDLERGLGRVSADIKNLPDTRHPGASVYTVGGHLVRVQFGGPPFAPLALAAHQPGPAVRRLSTCHHEHFHQRRVRRSQDQRLV